MLEVKNMSMVEIVFSIVAIIVGIAFLWRITPIDSNRSAKSKCTLFGLTVSEM